MSRFLSLKTVDPWGGELPVVLGVVECVTASLTSTHTTLVTLLSPPGYQSKMSPDIDKHPSVGKTTYTSMLDDHCFNHFPTDGCTGCYAFSLPQTMQC